MPAPKHSWTFPRRFRARAFGWRSSALAIQRLREAVSEIRVVGRHDSVLAGEGAVLLLERIWPALETVDGSSGALGTAVGHAVHELAQVVIDAPADEATRGRWLRRLWNALEEDGVEYLAEVGDCWGELVGSAQAASRWADELLPLVRMVWGPERVPGEHFYGTTACLSCLLAAGRYRELLELLESAPHRLWHYRQFGFRALLAMGEKAEAVRYPEESNKAYADDRRIACACEEVLLSSGMAEEA